jgi:hypothetical protein
VTPTGTRLASCQSSRPENEIDRKGWRAANGFGGRSHWLDANLVPVGLTRSWAWQRAVRRAAVGRGRNRRALVLQGKARRRRKVAGGRKRPLPLILSEHGFKSLRDAVEMELRPLTLLSGRNSSGKSSLMQPLLLLKQTLEASFDYGPLRLDGPNVHSAKPASCSGRARPARST